MATTVIGLDIGHRGVKAAILSTTIRGFELVAVGEVPFPDPSRDPSREEISRALEEVAAKVGPGPVVITSVAGESVSYKTVALPFTDQRQVSRALPFALDDATPFPLEEYVWDEQRLSPLSDGKSQTLCALTPRPVLTELLEDLKARNLDPKEVTTPTLALASLYRQILKPSGELEILVDVGHKLTHVVAVKAGEVLALRTVVWGGRNVTEALARQFNISFEKAEQGKHHDAFVEVGNFRATTEEQRSICRTVAASLAPLVQEVAYTGNLASSRTQERPVRILLTGGGSRLKNLDLYLWEQTGVPCESLKVLADDYNALPEGYADEDKLAVPLGLATYGMGYKGKLINLRKDAFAFAGEFNYYKRQIIQVVAGMLVIGLFSLFSVGTTLWAMGHQYSQLEDRMSEVTTRIIGKSVTNIKQAKAIINEALGGGVGDEELPLPELRATEIIYVIAEKLNQAAVDVKLKEIAIKSQKQGTKVKVKGNADSIPSVSVIKEKLAEHPCFKKMTAGPTRKAIGSDETEFSFDIDVSCEGVDVDSLRAAMLAGSPAAAGEEAAGHEEGFPVGPAGPDGPRVPTGATDSETGFPRGGQHPVLRNPGGAGAPVLVPRGASPVPSAPPFEGQGLPATIRPGNTPGMAPPAPRPSAPNEPVKRVAAPGTGSMRFTPSAPPEPKGEDHAGH